VSDEARLFARMGDGGMHEFLLDRDSMDIGRDPGCEIHLDSRFVSRRHARIVRIEGGFAVEDAQSTNGLKINGVLTQKRHVLGSGDCISLGDVMLTFEAADDALATAVYSAGNATDFDAVRLAATGSGRREAPAGLRAILFTDLVDHTRELVRVGDIAGQAWVRQHTIIVREQLRRYNGREEKWTGDGFLVTFDSARLAAQCAMAIQQAVREQNASGGLTPVHVRVGLHSGEVLREDGELFGNAVVLAARIMAQAGSDEVLISELMYRLLQPAGEFDFVDRGLFPLKGFPEEQRLFELRWDDAATRTTTDEPPGRSIEG
jgi:class 3 adenylate cyclase